MDAKLLEHSVICNARRDKPIGYPMSMCVCKRVYNIAAFAWKRKGMTDWALGHVQPTRKTLHLEGPEHDQEWAETQVKVLIFGKFSHEDFRAHGDDAQPLEL